MKEQVLLFLTLVILSLFCQPLLSQVSSHGNGASARVNNNNSVTVSITVPVSNNALLMVSVRNEDSRTVVGATFNSLPLTELSSLTIGSANAEIWYLVLGNLAAALTSTVSVSISGNSSCIITASSYGNVNQAMPVVSFVNATFGSAATSSSLGISSGNGDLVYDAISTLGGSNSPVLTFGANQTEIITNDYEGNPKARLSNSIEAAPGGGGTVTMSWAVMGNTNGNGIHQVANIEENPVLPVELTSFSARAEGSSARLDWRTASERDNEGFQVQRSADGIEWEDLEFVPGSGTTTGERAYSLTDEEPLAGNNYYRLRQMDFDGNVSWSQVRVVSMEETGMQAIPIWYSAMDNTIRVGEQATLEPLFVFNTNGQALRTSNRNWVDASGLPCGVYVVSAKTSTGFFSRKIFIP